MKKIWNWIVMSSADPTKYALTVKGAIVFAIPFIVQFSGIASEAELNQFADNVMVIVQSLLLAIGGVLSVIGFIRKVYLSLK